MEKGEFEGKNMEELGAVCSERTANSSAGEEGDSEG